MCVYVCVCVCGTWWISSLGQSQGIILYLYTYILYILYIYSIILYLYTVYTLYSILYIYTYRILYIHTHTYTHTHIHTYTHIHTQTHIHTYIHKHTHTYTYTHTHRAYFGAFRDVRYQMLQRRRAAYDRYIIHTLYAIYSITVYSLTAYSIILYCITYIYNSIPLIGYSTHTISAVCPFCWCSWMEDKKYSIFSESNSTASHKVCGSIPTAWRSYPSKH
jgi:hypothetical protein